LTANAGSAHGNSQSCSIGMEEAGRWFRLVVRPCCINLNIHNSQKSLQYQFAEYTCIASTIWTGSRELYPGPIWDGSMSLEHFLEAHQHTTAALEAVSTFAAVVISLVLALLAYRSSRTRIRAWVQVQFIFHPTLDGRSKPEYVTVTITNIGVMPASIPVSFFAWKVPFYSDYLQVLPWDYAQHDRWVSKRSATARGHIRF
jgi:hypothetical protein